MKVNVVRLPHYEGLELPAYATDGAAAMDLRAAIYEPHTLEIGKHTLIPTGLSVEIPPGYELQIRSRSGLANKSHLIIPNAPVTIDSDYRGEIFIGFINLNYRVFTFERGMRIAQALLAPVTRIEWEEVTQLSETGRGSGAFGSTGEA
jgi:dUTP pyrophosphatase